MHFGVVKIKIRKMKILKSKAPTYAHLSACPDPGVIKWLPMRAADTIFYVAPASLFCVCVLHYFYAQSSRETERGK